MTRRLGEEVALGITVRVARVRIGRQRRWIKQDLKRTVKKGEIRFSRDNRTRWSHDRTR
jgi:hypothetical protein